jgi:hypothetical protein
MRHMQPIVKDDLIHASTFLSLVVMRLFTVKEGTKINNCCTWTNNVKAINDEKTWVKKR